LKEIHTEIHINGSPDDVWQFLIDFTNYYKWNPFIVNVKGNAAVGTELEVQIKTRKNTIRTYRPVVSKVVTTHELHWHGGAVIPGILNGKRVFKVEQLEDKSVLFIHREIFTGLGAWLVGKRLLEDVQRGLERMNQALKQQVEAKVKSGTG
jgi:hypothetical protein